MLILCWSIVLFLALVGGLALPYNILPFMCTESLAGSAGPTFLSVFPERLGEGRFLGAVSLSSMT